MNITPDITIPFAEHMRGEDIAGHTKIMSRVVMCMECGARNVGHHRKVKVCWPCRAVSIRQQMNAADIAYFQRWCMGIAVFIVIASITALWLLARYR